MADLWKDVLCKIFNVSMKNFLIWVKFYYFNFDIAICVCFCFVLFRYIFYVNDSQFLVFNSDILIWMKLEQSFIQSFLQSYDRIYEIKTKLCQEVSS